MKTYLEKRLEDPDNLRRFLQERAIYEVTELLESLMGEMNITRSELARRLGKSRGWVTQLLDGEANKTIRTIADVFAVLGREYRSFSQPIQISRTSRLTSQTECSQEPGIKTIQFGQPEDRQVVISMHSSGSSSAFDSTKLSEPVAK